MSGEFLKKGLSLLTKRQTNILSAAFVIMATIIFSQILGLVRYRLLVAIFGASNVVGVFLTAVQIPDSIFQIVIAGALASSFIPVFTDFLAKDDKNHAYKFASSLLAIGLLVFGLITILLFVFAPIALQFFNIGGNYHADEMILMVNLMRIVLLSQLLFIIGSFLSAMLQSYRRFFIPGFAAALINLGTVICIAALSSFVGIYSAAIGMVVGAFCYILVQVPFIKKEGFAFLPSLSLNTPGVKQVLHLMWPRSISLGVTYFGSATLIAFISFIPDPGRNRVIFDFAQTINFAPVALIGQAIAQAALPILAKEKEKLDDFKTTFLTSFMQLLYLVLPISVLFLVLRIPVVRLIYGAYKFDWPATVLTGKVLAVFSLSIFAQALLYLVLRAFYALHDTKTPLLVSFFSTLLMTVLCAIFIVQMHLGITSLAVAYSIANILQLLILMIVLDRKVSHFSKKPLFFSLSKIFLAAFFTGFALYIPIKLLDQLVFDTTYTVNLLLLTGISSFVGLTLYVFLTWVFNVKEATTFILLFKRLGNWREILGTNQEVIDPTRRNL